MGNSKVSSVDMNFKIFIPNNDQWYSQTNLFNFKGTFQLFFYKYILYTNIMEQD